MKSKVLITVITCTAVLILAGCSGAAGNTMTPTLTLSSPVVTFQAPSSSVIISTSTLPATVATPPASFSSAPVTNFTLLPTATTPPLPTTTVVQPATTPVAPSTTAPPMATSAPATSQNPLGGKPTELKSHPADGAYAACLSCHLNTINPSPVLHRVDIRHACDQCHAMVPMPETIPHADELIANTDLIEITCVECHRAPEEK